MTRKEKEALFNLLSKAIKEDGRHIPSDDGLGAETAEDIRLLCLLYDKQTGHKDTFGYLAGTLKA